VFGQAPGTVFGGTLLSWSLILFGMALPWLLLAFGVWLAYQMIRQNGRLLLRLEALERRLEELSSGSPPAVAPAPSPRPALPIGAPAPGFELPDLNGHRRSLADFLGTRLLLVFFNPRCGFCTRMAPDLAALPTDAAEGRPLPLLVSTGDPEENRRLVAEHGLRGPVLLQERMEVAARYGAHGTPMGYLLDEDGRIASAPAVGADALLALAEGRAEAVAGNGKPAHRGNRKLSDSKLKRDGLPAGSPAPEFTLPALGGGEVSLSAYRGQQVLLVFSDPNCGPCQKLTPELAEFHRQWAGAVLMVSRGEESANQAKAAAHGVTFPIGLQKQWEVSRAYAMFATPIAYRIDAEGSIAAEVAVGAEPIRALMARVANDTAVAVSQGARVTDGGS
jgi:peroxiredoxin